MPEDLNDAMENFQTERAYLRDKQEKTGRPDNRDIGKFMMTTSQKYK